MKKITFLELLHFARGIHAKGINLEHTFFIMRIYQARRHLENILYPGAE